MSRPAEETTAGGRGNGGDGWTDPDRNDAEALARVRAAEAEARARHSDEKVFPLIRRIADDVTTLFSKELALLKAEMTSALRDTRTGIAAMASGGAVLYGGFLMLLLAAVLGLAQVMEAWLAALVVGAVALIVGAVMLSIGKNKVEPEAFKPEHTAASMRKDRDMIKRNIHEQRNR